jgi:hypothetical protein
MHSHRLASLLLGGWLIAGILMDFMAIQNFRTVDRFLAEPTVFAAQDIKALGGHDPARLFLRQEVGERNRFLFEQWEIVQIILGLAFIGAIVFGHGDPSKSTLLTVAAMLVIVCVDRFYLTPRITDLGRLIDYPGQAGANPALFWTLHGWYSGLELLKLALGFVCAGTLLVRHTDRKRFVREREHLTRRPAQAHGG